MPPSKTPTGHGALFDEFPSRPATLHGGAKFDEGFQLQPKTAPKGNLFDQFGSPAAASSEHGEVWDEFGWKDMPELHGGLTYDEGFTEPSANGTSRGPLFDLFEPSTQVKFIYGGQDSEGIVDHVVGDGIVMVRPRGGGDAVEVGLEQFLAYKSPSMDNATIATPPSPAGEPSAHSETARGHTGMPMFSDGNLGPIVDRVAPGPGNPDERVEIPEDWSIVDHLKTLLGAGGNVPDVTKAGIGYPTPAADAARRAARDHQHAEFEGHAGAAASHLHVLNREHHELHGKSAFTNHFEEALEHVERSREHNQTGAFGTRSAHLEIAKGHTTLGAANIRAARSRHVDPADESLQHAMET